MFQVFFRRYWDEDLVPYSKRIFNTEKEAEEYADEQWDSFDHDQGLTREVLEERGTDFLVRKIEA